MHNGTPTAQSVFPSQAIPHSGVGFDPWRCGHTLASMRTPQCPREWCFCWGRLLLVLGLGSRLAAQPLIELGESWRFLNATPELATNTLWRQPDFSDAQWYLAPSGFGNSGHGEQTRYDSAPGDWSTVLFRKAFVVPDTAAIRNWSLRLDYSEGFLVYLNGQEVARRGFPPASELPEVPTDAVPAYRTYGQAEVLTFTNELGPLRAGTNWLAVRVQRSFGGRPVFVPELLANFLRTPYVQLVTSNSATVLWRTPTPESGRVDVGQGGEFFITIPSPLVGTNHEVAITGLSPDTTYQYRVVLSPQHAPLITATNNFRTLPAAGPLTVAVFGDSGWSSAGQYAVARQLRQSGAQLLLHVGDVVYPWFSSSLADLRFLSVYRRSLEGTPFYSVWGNHDFLYSAEWNRPYRDVIRQPVTDVSADDLASERAWPGAYYSFDAGDVHFAMLFLPLANVHTLSTNSPQYKWLDTDLAATTKPWKVLLQHHPVFTSSAHRRDLYGGPPVGFYDTHLIRANLLPLARKHGVQLICSGHDHNYERFLPVDGVHTLVTGGGGGGLYYPVEFDSLSSQFYAAFHYTKLTFEGDTLQVRPIGTSGAPVDGFSIRRTASPSRINVAAWMTPVIENGAGTVDGNHPGQSYEYLNAGVAEAKTGDFANLGRTRVALDKTHLYLGLESLMLPHYADAYLFLEVPGQVGVTNLLGLGNGRLDPAEEAVDALDLLENLDFELFTPSIAAVVGDEFADDTYRGWARTPDGPALGQGVFRLTPGFPSVPGILLQQYNRSPQDTWGAPERNADFVEIAIPRSQLGGVKSGDVLRLGVVVGGADLDPVQQTRNLDSGFLGEGFTETLTGRRVLRPVQFQLPDDPDPDSDGLNAAQEIAARTDPNNSDTDQDGLPDGWEVGYGLNPTSPAGIHGPDGDPDADSLTNAEEFARGSHPNDAASPPPPLKWIWDVDGSVVFGWRTVTGRRYLLQSATTAAGPYRAIGGFPRVASGTTDQHRISPGGASEFYRVTVQP